MTLTHFEGCLASDVRSSFRHSTVVSIRCVISSLRVFIHKFGKVCLSVNFHWRPKGHYYPYVTGISITYTKIARLKTSIWGSHVCYTCSQFNSDCKFIVRILTKTIGTNCIRALDSKSRLYVYRKTYERSYSLLHCHMVWWYG